MSLAMLASNAYERYTTGEDTSNVHIEGYDCVLYIVRVPEMRIIPEASLLIGNGPSPPIDIVVS